MAEITAALVKDLREKTGVGMMDCKKALAENDGDLEAAIDWLRAKGLSKAAKKADRAAAEGLVAVGARRHARRCRRAELRDRLRRPQRRLPEGGARVRASWRSTAGDHDALLDASARRRQGVGRGDQPDRHHRREHHAAPLGRSSRSSNGVVAAYVHRKVDGPDNSAASRVLVALESTGDKAALGSSARRSPCTSPRRTRSR